MEFLFKHLGALRIFRILRSCSLLVLLLLQTLLFSGCGENKPSSVRPAETPARTVRIFKAEKVPMDTTIAALGSLVPIDQALLSAKVPGRMRRFLVDVGSSVKKGDLLAELESEDYQLKVRQAEAMLGQARARLGLDPKGENERVDPDQTSLVKQARAVLLEAEKNKARIEGLAKAGISSEAEVEVAVANYEVLRNKFQDAQEEVKNRVALLAQRRAEFEIAQQQLSDIRIMAPFEGVIQERKAHLGEFLQAAAPIVSLVRMNPLRVRAEVSEREAHRLHEGQVMNLKTSNASNKYSARISRISPALDLQTRMLTIEADVVNGGELRPGYFVSVEIITSTNELATVVPKEALVTFAGIEKVFVYEKGIATERRVTTGRRANGTLEILQGIQPGEFIILSPGGLQTGEKVSPNS